MNKDQLVKILEDVIDLYNEYQEKHGQSPEAATNSAIVEVLESLELSGQKSALNIIQRTARRNPH